MTASACNRDQRCRPTANFPINQGPKNQHLVFESCQVGREILAERWLKFSSTRPGRSTAAIFYGESGLAEG